MTAPDFFSDLDIEEKPQTKRLQAPVINKSSAPDFFSDIPSDETPDFLSSIQEEPKPKNAPVETPEKSFLSRTLESFGKGLAIQSQIRGGGGPEGLKQVGEFGKGALSGTSIGLSEKIPGLKPEEGNFLAGVGDLIGSAVPITKIYNILGKPLVRIASQSPKMANGLKSLARMTGFGLTGATYEGAKDTIKSGEVPSMSELGKYGLQWAAFDGALQLVGKAASFIPKLGKFAKAKNIPEKEALNEVIDTLNSEKIDLAKNPEAAVARAEEIIAEEIPFEKIEKGEIKLAAQPLEAIEPSSQKIQSAAKEIDSIPVEKRTPEQTEVVSLSKLAQPGDNTEKLFESVPIPEDASFLDRAKKYILKPSNENTRQLNAMKENYFSKKWGIEWSNRNKWNKMVKENKFKQKELSDMMFYVENPEVFPGGRKKSDPGTGNPFVNKEDTYAALEKRLSPEAKKTVNEVINPHFKEWLKTINESAYTKKINPREFLEGVYIPHFYESTSAKSAKQAMELFSKRFSTNNPFANMRTFLSYNEALQKAGMTPRFDNIADLLNEYDRVMTRVMVNSEFAGQIADLEKEIGSKLIVRSNSPKYAEAKKEGWVPFEDPYLRRYAAGTDKEGKPIFATLETPALVHPDAAEAFTGIFIKDAQKPRKGGEMALWKGFDALSDFLKSAHVFFSGFHFLTLAEESAKSSGINLINSFKRGGKLLQDPVFMRDFVEAGGVIGHNTELINRSASNMKTVEQGLLLSGGPKKLVGDALRGTREIIQKPSKFLFEEFQPRLKVASFFDMRSRYLQRLSKKGIAPDAKQMKQINREIGSLANDMFGGQRFELMRNPLNFKPLDLNDPKVLKAWKRAGGYVDWTASAIREFAKTVKGATEFLPGVEKTPAGTAARHNALRYLRNLFIATQMMNYYNTGLKRDSEGNITWDSSKAHSTFENDDPSKYPWDMQLPDLEIDIGGHKFNIGKDDKGRRLYTHFGKKFLENIHWFQDPIKQLFNKANPVWQTLFVQAFGGTPSLRGTFPAEASERMKPWEGKKGWDTLAPRLKHLIKMPIPYSLKSFTERDAAAAAIQFLTLGLGSLPPSKGMNLDKAADYYDTYFYDERNHQEDIAKLDRLLKSNGYKESQIKSLKSTIRNRIRAEKEAG